MNPTLETAVHAAVTTGPAAPAVNPHAGLLRWAAGLELAGLALEALALLRLTPDTFVLFALGGAPLLAAGMGLFFLYRLRTAKTGSAA